MPAVAGIEFRAHLPWDELQRLFREATLLVQPMLNDPWGQVYLEAMVSRTPVMGLAATACPNWSMAAGTASWSIAPIPSRSPKPS